MKVFVVFIILMVSCLFVPLTDKPYSEELSPMPVSSEAEASFVESFAFLHPFLDESSSVTVLEPLNSEYGEIKRFDVTSKRGISRAWYFPDGSLFWCEQTTSSFSLSLSGFDSLNQLDEDSRSPFLAEGESGSAIIQPPLARSKSFKDGKNYLADDLYNGTVLFKDEKVNISFNSNSADWWIYISPVPFEEKDWIETCSVFKFGGDNRFTLDGYYYKTPALYTPTGDGLFYIIPSPHIGIKLICKSDLQVARQLAIPILDTQRRYIEEDGYIPTPSRCNWLYEDYEIENDFFDTRFNTDYARALLISGVAEFEAPARKYGEFFINFAKYHNFETENGILVEDYSHYRGNKKTNASLNHNAAEILFLIELEDEKADEVAQMMLCGIEDTEKDWIREDKDFHYAIYPDKGFSGADYVYLTYNDLLALDRKLGGNEALKRLMDAKREYLISNGYNEYDK